MAGDVVEGFCRAGEGHAGDVGGAAGLGLCHAVDEGAEVGVLEGIEEFADGDVEIVCDLGEGEVGEVEGYEAVGLVRQ